MYDNLPPAITAHKAFLVWKFVPNDNPGKKPLKMPMYAGTGKWRKGVHGSRDDRQSLVSFDKAASVLRTSKKHYDGLGMALLPDWKLVAVDFDDCVVKGVVHPEVLELVSPTYWEFSPSGKGIRAFFSGHVRDGKSIRKEWKAERGFGVEFFCAKGFVTITGNTDPAMELAGMDVVPLTPGIMALYTEAIGSRDVNTDNADQATVGMTDEEIKRMLDEEWDADCDYETWLNVGMAIHHETHGEGFELWDEWSSKGGSYPGEQECQYKWESFGRDGGRKSLKTIRWMLNEKGINFALENSCAVDELGGPLPDQKALVDAKGKEVKSLKLGALKPKNNGMLDPTMTNIHLALGAPGFCGWEFKKDTFLCRTLVLAPGAEVWRELQDEDFVELMIFLEKRGFDRPSMEKVRQATSAVARDNQFNSAQRWLNEVVPEWDGVERIEHYAKNFLGATDDEEYARAVSLYAWTAHAGRVLQPGVKADMMPVLVGPQNVGKSYNIRAISPEASMFVALKFSHEDKVLVEKTVGKLVVEFPELDGLGKRDVNSIKEYITRQEERYRFPYDRMSQDIPRAFIMWGTSNDDQFLTDPTGNRRFLPLRVVGTGDVRFTPEDMVMHWAEAREKFKAHGIMAVEEANALAESYRERARVEDEWEELIERFLTEQKDDKGVLWGERGVISTDDLYNEALGVPAANRNNGTQGRLRAAMRRFGYTPGKATDTDGVRRRGFVRKISIDELV